MGISTIPNLSGKFGEEIRIPITVNEPGATHDLTIQFGSELWTFARGVGDSTSITVPLTYAQQIGMHNPSGWGNIYIDTIKNGQKLGTHTATITLTAIDVVDMKPTLNPSLTFVEASSKIKTLSLGLPADTFVQNISRITISDQNANTAITTRYGADVAQQTYTATYLTTGNGIDIELFEYVESEDVSYFTPKKAGQYRLAYLVYDTRGNSAYMSKDITVLEYAPPVIGNNTAISRVNNAQTTLTWNRTVSISPLIVGGTQKNKMKVELLIGEINKTPVAVTGTGIPFETTTMKELVNSQLVVPGTYDSAKGFVAHVKVTDLFNVTTRRIEIPAESVLVSYNKKAIGFGKVTSMTNAVDSEYPYYYKNKLIQHFRLTQENGYSLPANTNVSNNQLTGRYWLNGSITGFSNAPASWQTDQVFMDVQYGGVTTVGGAAKANVMQVAYNPSGAGIATRSIKNGAWSPWNYYMPKPSTDVDNWTKFGSYNCYYKRQGDVVSVRINQVTSPSNGNFILGTLPEALRPPQDSMFPGQAWVASFNGSALQVGSDGVVQLLATVGGTTYGTIVTWMV